MASEEMGLVPTQRLDNNGLNSQILFQDDNLRFNCAPTQQHPKHRHVGDPGPKTRELSGYFPPQSTADYCRTMFGDVPDRSQNWNGNGRTRTPSSDGSDDDDVDDEDEDGSDDDPDEGSSREVLMKGGNPVDVDHTIVGSSENNQQGRVDHLQNAVTIAEADGDMYYSQFIHGSDALAQGRKDMIVENGCKVSGRKDASFLNGSGESLRTILSDPLTGVLMDDAMILPCGHSFGGGGIQHVLKQKACTCSQSVSEDSGQPNLSLRAAVQAFRREEELHIYRATKRRRERFEDKSTYGDSSYMDTRGRGVQFPFVVSDRVIIKGNKRTPQRFVGREAVVTTQCLNGWYVVKTLDNAESVKLQYRSLAKVSDDLSSKPISNKVTPNWLLTHCPHNG